MSKYSSFFLLSSPKYEKLGDKLRMRKYGSWLAEESWLREEQSQKRAVFTLKAIELARKIAKEKNIEEMEAFTLLQDAGASGSEVASEYAQEIASLTESMPPARAELEQLVTAFFRNRGEVLQGKKWESTDEWTEEDTRMLPKSILQKVEEFMAKEETGAVDKEEKDEEEEGQEEEAKN